MSYLTFENIEHAFSVIFWALLYTSTAICAIAAVFSAVESMIYGNEIKYSGARRATGVRLTILGLAAIAATLVFAAFMTGLANGIVPMISKMFAAQTGGDMAGLIAMIISWIIFDIGVWMTLTSEEPRPLKH